MFKIKIWYNGMTFMQEYKCDKFRWGEGHSGILIFEDIKNPKMKCYFISIHNTDCIEIENLTEEKHEIT